MGSSSKLLASGFSISEHQICKVIKESKHVDLLVHE